MKDTECVSFLQWVLPRLHRSWPGFRKVRRQVCRRVDRRLRALHLSGPGAYRDYLERHPEEWGVLDGLCPITISCFYRDKAVFDALTARVLPELARRAAARGGQSLRALSLGCASGEEPYTVMLAWRLAVAPMFPGTNLQIVASDVLEDVLERARIACYPESSLKLLPRSWRDAAFADRTEARAAGQGWPGCGLADRIESITTASLPHGPQLHPGVEARGAGHDCMDAGGRATHGAVAEGRPGCAFAQSEGLYCLRPEFRREITFVRQDVRTGLPDGMFDLILCRNLVFTYFDEPSRQEILGRLLAHLVYDGALVIGRRETLPPGPAELSPWPGATAPGIYRYRASRG